MGSSLHWPAGPAWAPHGVTGSFRHPPALAWDPFRGLQRDNLPHHGLHHELQGKTLCSSVSSTSSHSFFTDLGVCRFVSHLLTPLSNCHLPTVFFFPAKTCYHRGTTTIGDWLGLGHQRVCLRAGWCWLYQTWGKLLAASHRSHPYCPPATKTLPCKPITTASDNICMLTLSY